MATQTTESSISRLSRRLLIGVGLGFAAIMLALVVVGTALNRSHRAIARDLERIANVEEPVSAAAYEMEINILGAGMAVQKYLVTGDPAHRERLAKDEADFDRFRAEYERLVDTPAAKDFGKRIDALNERYRATGRTLIEFRDQREALHLQLSARVEEIDRVFDGFDFVSPDRGAKYREALSLEADIGELGMWLGNHLLNTRPAHRERVLDDLGHAEEHLDAFQKLPLNPAETALADRVKGVVGQISGDLDRILRVQDALREGEVEFTQLRSELDTVLDEGIQAMTRRELMATQHDARENLARSAAISLSVIGVSALLVIAVAVGIARRVAKLGAMSAGELQSAFERLQISERRRGALLQRLVSAQEEERARIARELHDQLGQDLSALSLGLASLRRAPPGPPTDDPRRLREIQALQDLANRVTDEVHHVAWKLRPAILDDLGMHGALSNLLETWSKHTGVPVDLYCDMQNRRLPGALETTLYRVVQEALTNVSKHARAGSVNVVLQPAPDRVRLVVEDDGCGFDVGRVLERGSLEGHFGLLGMYERIEQADGTLEIDSSPENGTTIVVSIPIPASDTDGVAE